MTMHPIARGAALLLTLATLVGCDRLDSTAAAELASHELEQPPSHVDSIFPVEEEIRRFRAQLGGAAATRLTGGADSRDALVALFIAALEASDRAALERLAVTPAEFIDLYYPHTRFTSRPYELAPQLVWFQLENYSSKGLHRALDRFGGRPLGYRRHECSTVTQEGPNRITGGCAVHIDDGQGARGVSLFWQIIERDGAFKFLGFGNSL